MDLGKGRQLRSIDRADKPKPRNTDNGGKDGFVPHRFTKQGFCTPDNIPLDFRICCFGGYGRHKQAADRPSDGDQQNQYPDNIRRRTCHRSPQYLTEQDGDKRTGFNQAVSHNQLFVVEVIRQDGVFQRAEQRRLRAHAKQTGQKQRGRPDIKPVCRHCHNDNFQHLNPTRQNSLVEFIA